MVERKPLILGLDDQRPVEEIAHFIVTMGLWGTPRQYVTDDRVQGQPRLSEDREQARRFATVTGATKAIERCPEELTEAIIWTVYLD